MIDSFATRFRAVGAIICLLVTIPINAHEASFTLEEVMQAPYPSDLTTAPAGGAVAWVFNSKGCRNIWVAEAEQHSRPRARAITSYTEDDGFDIGELAWSPDTNVIAFTRGQALEDDLPANVNSSPEGPTPREVMTVSKASGAVQKLGVGHAPSYSPDGQQLLFIDGKTIFSVAADGSGAARALIVDQGVPSSVTWAPDGQRLAFVSHRGAHTLIGVYEVSTRKLVWMHPSLDEDSEPTFSPDGLRVAFIHQLAVEHPEFISRRTGPPWSIQVADVRTGEVHLAWTADAGAGSVYHPTASKHNLFWAAGDELVFPWEKTGWSQLYAVPARGGSARALTSGEFEVTHVVLSPDRRKLVYSSNQGDSDRMHLWAVDIGTAQAVRQGRSSTIEDHPQAGSDGTLYALQSDGNQPLHPVMLSSDGDWRRLAAQAIPASFPWSKLVMPHAVSFVAKDGQEVHGQIFVPRETTSARRPAVLFFHGGPRRQMLLGFHPMSAYSWMYAFNQYLAAKGFLVLSVNYRGGTGYGLRYREADAFGPGGGSELNDLLGAVEYLRGRPDVDGHRLGIWGASYGGLMTALGLARASDSLAVGVDYAGVHDWVTFLKEVGTPTGGAEDTRRAFESSPMATVEQWRSPVLVVQADDDRNVPAQQAAELIEGLRAHHVDHEVVVIPNEIHDLAHYSSWMSLFRAADGYLDRHLPSASPAR